ncbi:hypothetical protein H2199_001651 [Coniosporium tulheliwenetii]|uniref:Uncharacterized protein n=1 Tax=Coniosporium tulheliwenetii TaxID=3383036 RepID=A0ACC2ZK20_9PEZI|nr:hypothetical protein H2199_001651 [Cladosporium sp. JES 115]
MNIIHVPPSPTAIRGEQQTSWRSVSPSEQTSTVIGYESEPRMVKFGEEDETDFQSEVVFDQVRTKGTRSTSGARGPRIQTIFDDSPPGKSKVTALRDLLPKGTFRDPLPMTLGDHGITEDGEVISTPVRSVIHDATNVITNKFGTWGVGSKGVTEDWNDDFDFAEADEADAEPSKLDDGDEKRIDSGVAMFVPRSIREQQSNVLANIGLLREWGLLIEELKELRIRATVLGLIGGRYLSLWQEIDAMIDLADQEAEEPPAVPCLSPPSSPQLDLDLFDDVTPNASINGQAKRRSGLSVAEEFLGGSASMVLNGSRTRRKSILPSDDDIFIIEALKRKTDTADATCVAQDVSPTKKVPFDTATLRHIVPYVNGLMRKVKDVLREAEGLYSSPQKSPPPQEPALSQLFQNPPNNSPSSRRARRPKNSTVRMHSDDSFDAKENELTAAERAHLPKTDERDHEHLESAAESPYPPPFSSLYFPPSTSSDDPQQASVTSVHAEQLPAFSSAPPFEPSASAAATAVAETKAVLPQDTKDKDGPSSKDVDDREPPPPYTVGSSPLDAFTYVMATAGGPASIITQVSQGGAPPINTLGAGSDENITLELRGVRFPLSRDELLTLPEFVLLSLFPNGLLPDGHMNYHDGDVYPVDVSAPKFIVQQKSPQCVVVIRQSLSNVDLYLSDRYYYSQYDPASLQYMLDFFRKVAQSIPTSPPSPSTNEHTEAVPIEPMHGSARDMLQDRAGIIVLREDLDFYAIPPRRDIEQPEMIEIKRAAGKVLLKQDGIFSGLRKSEEPGTTEQHLIEMLTAGGFNHDDRWGHRAGEPNKAVICSIALARLRTDVKGNDLSSNNAVGMAQKLLLFWRKPARRCWWEGVDLEGVEGVEGKLKVWIRRVWTLEMVSHQKNRAGDLEQRTGYTGAVKTEAKNGASGLSSGPPARLGLSS